MLCGLSHGTNDGTLLQKTRLSPATFWQHTSKGRLEGYNGDLDSNCLTETKPLEYFSLLIMRKRRIYNYKQLADIFLLLSPSN